MDGGLGVLSRNVFSRKNCLDKFEIKDAKRYILTLFESMFLELLRKF